LFKPFEQAETSTSRKYGGTGLGLVICKSIVNMMDGDIWVDSEPGKGAVFAFTVRLACIRSEQLSNQSAKSLEDDYANKYTYDHIPETPSEKEADYEGRHILLVEDVDINREIVIALLEPTKVTIDCAENGLEAVDAFVSNPHKYDIIFMDIQMPEMDGYTATRQIRDSGAPRARDIPIVAMTANAFKEDIERCLEAGMDEHIGKPLALERVLEALDRFMK